MADALTLEATVQWRPRSGAFPPPWSTRLSSLLLAVLYPHAPGRGRSLCSLEPLRRKVDGATMSTPVGRAQRYATHCHIPRARRTGFSHGVGAPTGPPLGVPTLRFAPLRCRKVSLRWPL